MGKLKEWVGSALLAQPFYIEELRMIGLRFARALWASFIHAATRWRGAATQRKINI
ncbi:hypothetical protein [Sphingomonas adhaesiva]|uniref:hypothetical protein n=1 Tax=Sphingomonas adhaesiva TaxID=28212 RepID=UPI000A529C4A|nr:hypothetical protein [Sphingomonas adhaesiva]